MTVNSLAVGTFSVFLVIVRVFGPARVCGSALHASPARPRGCRGPASRLSASQPFPQFERAAGFTGFTLTPLTPRTRPPTATHPASGQWRRDHVPITHRLACDWPRPATPLRVIGCVLPPARLLAILFLCFFRLFFFGSLSCRFCWQRLGRSDASHIPLCPRGAASLGPNSSGCSAVRRSAAVR